jgi:hypothetical protein
MGDTTTRPPHRGTLYPHLDNRRIIQRVATEPAEPGWDQPARLVERRCNLDLQGRPDTVAADLQAPHGITVLLTIGRAGNRPERNDPGQKVRLPIEERTFGLLDKILNRTIALDGETLRKPTPRAALWSGLDVALVAGVDPSRSYVCAYVRRQFLAPVFDRCRDASEVERHGEAGDCRGGGPAWRECLGGGAAARDQAEPSVPLAATGPRSAALFSRSGFLICYPSSATSVFGTGSTRSIAVAKFASAGGSAGCGRRKA